MFDLKNIIDTAQEAHELSVKNTHIFTFPEGEHEIRILPNKYDKDGKNGIIHAYIHYRDVLKDTSFSPKTFGKPDPFESWVDSALSKGKVSTEEFKKLMQFKPKHVYLVPVLVRPKESDTTKEFVPKWMVLTGGRASDPAWKKGGQYEKIIDAMAGAFRKRLNAGDKIDVTDTTKGHDFTATVIGKDKTTSGYKEVSFVFEQIPSTLHDDPAVVKRLLNDQPDWKTLFEKPTEEEMLTALELFMNREDEDDEESNTVTTPTAPVEVASKEADELVAKAEAYFAKQNNKAPSVAPSVAPSPEPSAVSATDDDDSPF